MASTQVFGIGKWFIRSCNNTYGFVCQQNLGEFKKESYILLFIFPNLGGVWSGPWYAKHSLAVITRINS